MKTREKEKRKKERSRVLLGCCRDLRQEARLVHLPRAVSPYSGLRRGARSELCGVIECLDGMLRDVLSGAPGCLASLARGERELTRTKRAGIPKLGLGGEVATTKT